MRIARPAALAAAVCLLAAGCGTVPYQARTTARTQHPHRVSGVPSSAHNEVLAAREAARLLARTPLPAGAAALPRVPRALARPVIGPAAAQSLVDKTKSWRLPLPFARARAWVTAHRPDGLAQSDTGTIGGRGGVTAAGYAYGAPATAAWQSAELVLSVAPDGPHASYLRADGSAIWLDPRPVRFTTPGPRARLTVAGPCPATDQHVVGVRNPGSGLTRRLLPAGQPLAGRECRYYGLNGHPWRLRSTTRLTAARARRLAAAMNRIPLSHTLGGVFNCPMDDGSAEIIALSYPGRPDVDLWDPLNGCVFISNGFILVGGP
jgi:hypothetical protein